MGFFFGSKPKVSRFEFKHVRNYLFEKGFTLRQISDVEGFFHGDLNESGDQAGISKHEAEKTINWMREHKHHHTFSDSQIDTIEHALNKYL